MSDDAYEGRISWNNIMYAHPRPAREHQAPGNAGFISYTVTRRALQAAPVFVHPREPTSHYFYARDNLRGWMVCNASIEVYRNVKDEEDEEP